ncbi:transmembrane 4 L6 family member 4 [Fundulus heteroclitus]|uniref:transmembrane 4 L6 family member 4 n=1 Tax=Fundulus heteroclitus TaxID=8078 RepID=UPI00165B519C|nr:transmembrane 4 L6 family member 4 [Fundulus heteroclitus]XP_021174474.2 transmembrane 4 L6 family member 4 [Fundulus heteroclitus]
MTAERVMLASAAYPTLCLTFLSDGHATSHSRTIFTEDFPFAKQSTFSTISPASEKLKLKPGGRFYFQEPADMCTGKCSLCIAVTLYPLVLISIICNIVLFFPDGDIKYAKDDHITPEVKYMGGVIGGGILVLLPALYIHLTGQQGCCGNRCGMFLSIAFAAVGAAGALYSFIVAILGLKNGPLCKVLLIWMRPFEDGDSSYLSDSSQWWKCLEPENIIQFNIGLFSTLLVTSGLQLILCATQMINGLVGCLCGTCNKDSGMI